MCRKMDLKIRISEVKMEKYHVHEMNCPSDLISTGILKIHSNIYFTQMYKEQISSGWKKLFDAPVFASE